VGAALSSGVIVLLTMQVAGDLLERKCDELSWTCGGDSSRDALQKTPGESSGQTFDHREV